MDTKDLPKFDEDKFNQLAKKIFDEAWSCSFHDEGVALKHIKETLLTWWNSGPFES
jgi:hypothetical protein